MNIRLALWLPFVALVLVVACGSSGESEDAAAETAIPTPEFRSEAEQDYILRVGAALSLFASKAASFRAVLSQSYATSDRLFDALADAGAGTAYVESLEAVENIEPPRGYREDHVAVIATFKERVRIDAEIGRAIADSDLVSFVVLNARLGVEGEVSGLSLSPEICRVLQGPNADEFPPCRSRDPLPGGEYGLSLEEVTARLRAELSGRDMIWDNLQFRALATDEEFFAALMVVYPESIEILTSGLDTVSLLEPADSMIEDHELLLQYLRDQLLGRQEVFEAIQAEDEQLMDDLTANGLARYCETREALSPDFATIVNVFFGRGDAECSALQ